MDVVTPGTARPQHVVVVLLDATVIRMMLVPSIMGLLGERNWWLPRWLDRVLPKIHFSH